ncbi:hypothetical protein TNCV_4095941 [Trichonephila clavipes]|nr:hypothetical protein TNCV_4095941 [Trichonephila clavipes]
MYNTRHYESTLQQGFRYRVLLATQSHRNHERASGRKRGKVGDDPSAARSSAIGYDASSCIIFRSGRNHGVSSWITNCTL